MKYKLTLHRRRVEYEYTTVVVECPDGARLDALAHAVYEADDIDEHLEWSREGELFIEEADDLHDVAEAPNRKPSATVSEDYEVEFTR